MRSANRRYEEGGGANLRLREALLAYFFKRVQNRAEAEDLTQETFIRLAKHPDKSDGKTLYAYVFAIAANLLRDRARLRTRQHTLAHRSLEEGFEYSSPDLVEDRDPERVLMGKQALQHFWGAVGELNERTRGIFILSRLEGMPQREIARLYGISISAVEKHILKAQAHFAARFRS